MHILYRVAPEVSQWPVVACATPLPGDASASLVNTANIAPPRVPVFFRKCDAVPYPCQKRSHLCVCLFFVAELIVIVLST